MDYPRPLAALLALGLSMASGAAFAQQLVYRPINPSFGGNALNSGHLLGIANAQRPEEDRSTPQTTTTDRFLQILQSRLLSSLALDVTDAIFGEDAQDSGTIQLDDISVSFVNTGTEVEIVINDVGTGEITEIIVPTVIQ